MALFRGSAVLALCPSAPAASDGGRAGVSEAGPRRPWCVVCRDAKTQDPRDFATVVHVSCRWTVDGAYT
eukprot:5082781-Prymnesium_polylepis.1